MSKSKAAIETARGWHKLGLAVSATALVLLFAPQNADFGAALDEAYTLRDLELGEYEGFVRGFIGQNTLLPPRPGMSPGDWPLNITAFLNTEMGQNVLDGDFPNPTWDIGIAVDYQHPPNDGTLIDWFRWIGSTDSAQYYHPNWATADLSMSRDAGDARPLVRHFTLEPSRFMRSAGEYTFRAYFDLGVTASDQSEFANKRAVREDWWSELLAVAGERGFIDLGPDRWVVEGNVRSELRPATGSVNDWLRQSGIWERLSNTDNLGETTLPGIRAHWGQLSDMSLVAAISHMEAAQREINSVSLLGVLVPGTLCIVAIPLAYLLVHLSLLLDMRFLRSLQGSGVKIDPSEAPWMGLYDDTFAVWATGASIAAVPVMLMVGLLARYHPMVDTPVLSLSVTALIVATFVQVVAIRCISTVRGGLHEVPSKS